MITEKTYAQQAEYNLLAPVGRGKEAVKTISTSTDDGAKGIAEQYLFTDLFQFVVVLAALLAVLFLATTGLFMVLAQIHGNVFKYQQLKERFVRVLLGIALLLCSYVILETINPKLVTFGNFEFPSTNPVDDPKI